MKLVSFRYKSAKPDLSPEDGVSFGVDLDGVSIIDLRKVFKSNPMYSVQNLRELVEFLSVSRNSIHDIIAQSKDRLLMKDVEIVTPIQNPSKVVGVAVNYIAHDIELFNKPLTGIVGPSDIIPWPAFSKEVDYEAELGVVIGKRCSRVSVHDALEHAFGYTIINDVSARSATLGTGRQKRDRDDFFDWLAGKWGDGMCPIGPAIVTTDELPDPQRLQIKCFVNEELRQNSGTKWMIHSVADLISHISHITTLLPGDIIATGTPSGTGKALGRYLNEGDTIRCEIEGIGVLTNTMGDEPNEFFEPCKKHVT